MKEGIMAWKTVTDSGGNNYRLYFQDRSQSCGVACALTVIRLKVGKEVDGSSMRSAFGDAEGAVHLSKDGSGIRDFESAGSMQGAIFEALKKYGSAGWFRLPFTAKKVDSVSPKNPVILGVDWGVSGSGTKGGHWVCAVRQLGKLLVCLDPIYGVVELQRSLLPFYFTRDGAGRINDILLT
jgi:hypothetical protein